MSHSTEIPKSESELSQSILKELLGYNQETGIFTWKRRDLRWFKTERAWKIWNKRLSGKKTGNVVKCGEGATYIAITLFGKYYKAHRAAWLYVHGSWPENQIDHINGISTDNRISNLRDVPRRENLRNQSRYRNSTTGVTGVHWNKKLSKWQSHIGVDRRLKHLGVFDTLLDAVAARRRAEARYGFHANHGRDKWAG